MGNPVQDLNLAQWALSAATAALAAALSWLWQRIGGLEQRLDTRITAHEAATKAGQHQDTRDLWAAINDDRKRTADYRERTLERLSQMPTKADLSQMEDRLAKMVDRTAH